MSDATKHRAKLYELNSDGQWEDRGTGFARCQFSNTLNDLALVLESESDGHLLLETRLSGGISFTQQGDCIISWTEPESSFELALSFQESRGAEAVWSELPSESHDNHSDDERTEPVHSVADFPELQSVEYGSLQKWAEAVNDPEPKLAGFLMEKFVNGSMLPELVEVFQTATDMEDKESMQSVFAVLRGVLALTEFRVFEVAVRDEFFDSVLSILEADPELEVPPGHRAFMNHGVVYREIVSIPDPRIKERIKDNFRIMYIKDVAFNRHMTDNALHNISTTVVNISHEIVAELAESAEFIGNVFCALFACPVTLPGDAPETLHADTPVTRGDVLRFLQELCALVRTQSQIRDSLFRAMCSFVPAEDVPEALQPAKHALLPALDAILCDPLATVKEKLSCMDILHNLILSQCSTVRVYITDTRAKVPHPPPDGIYTAGTLPREAPVRARDALRCSLLGSIVAGIIAQPDSGLQVLAGQVLNKLVLPDPSDLSMDITDNKVLEEFLKLFYEDYLHWLVYPFCPTIAMARNNACMQPNGVAERRDLLENMPISAIKAAKLCVTEALCSYVESHDFRIKYYVLRENIGGKLLFMANYPDRHLQIAALRFLRTLINMNEPFYDKYVVKNRLLDHAFALLRSNMDRDNMVSSTTLDLVKSIGDSGTGQGRTDLVNCIIDHAHEFNHGIAKFVFQQILHRNDIAGTEMEHRHSSNSEATRREAEAELKADAEERFFEEDGDDDQLAEPQPAEDESDREISLPTIGRPPEDDSPFPIRSAAEAPVKPVPKLSLRIQRKPEGARQPGPAPAVAAAPAPAPTHPPASTAEMRDASSGWRVEASASAPVAISPAPVPAPTPVSPPTTPVRSTGMMEESPSPSPSRRVSTPRSRSADHETAMDEETPSPKRSRTPTKDR